VLSVPAARARCERARHRPVPGAGAQTWRAVGGRALGRHSLLGPVKTWCIVVGGLVGIVLTLLPRIAPEHEHLVPSPAGVGLAWTFHCTTACSSSLGGALGWWAEKRYPKWSEEFTFPVASGWIAGESLMGVALVVWENGPELLRKLLGG